MSEVASSSRVPSRTQEANSLPKKQQWALIYDQKAKQFQRLKEFQKIRSRQKKQAFKQDLDNQINGKNNIKRIQKEEDRKYYEFIINKSQETKQKQEKDRLQKMNKMRNLQQENRLLHNINQNTIKNELNDFSTKYTFDIGLSSQIQRKRRQEEGRKKMIDALNKQINLKAELSLQQKIKNAQIQEKNKIYQQQQFNNRNRKNKNYIQNLNVYMQFKQLAVQKMKKQKELQHLIVQQAAKSKQQQQIKNRKQKEIKKHQLSNKMKQTLDQQVQIHNYKKQQQSKINPQQHSYSVIGSMFRDKISSYDKRQYSQFLKRQVQEHNRKKMSQNHMSQQQYKLNLNQLNKAVTGRYAYDKYHDRSLTNIGQRDHKINLSMNDLNMNNDTDLVRSRLETIRNKKPTNQIYNQINDNL